MSAILVIDDSESHRRQILEHLTEAGIFHRIVVAKDGLEGIRHLVSDDFDVVLCDLEMPGLNGEKLLRLQGPGQRNANVPFLFLTGSTDLDRKVRLLEDGACDTIAKPYHPADLIARLRLHLKVKRLQIELQEKNAILQEMSTTDGLTSLRTRRYARDFLAVEFLRARRYKTPLAIAMADLDYFKKINDNYGHPAGDAVLREVASLLKSSVRSTDVASRYGGEEMEFILTQNDAAGAVTVAERWRKAVEAAQIKVADGRVITVTLSVGVAEYSDAFQSPDDLETAADAALYAAKEAGRNRVVRYGAGQF